MQRILVWSFAALVAVFGTCLAVGGIVLLRAGGSAYYLVAGAATLSCAVLLVRGRRAAYWLFSAILVGTLIWSLWEVGFDGWPLAPRLIAWIVIGLCLLLPALHRASSLASRWWIGGPVIAMVAVLAASAIRVQESELPGAKAVAHDAADGDWRHYGRSLDGQRYSPLAQIDTSNVAKLQRAWEYDSGVPALGVGSFQMTPLVIDDRLFTCVDRNVIVALDPDTGREQWRFDPQTNLKNLYGTTCRGVTYYAAPAAAGECAQRVLFGVADGRLMAVDARTGKPCSGFGTGGAVDLTAGMGTLAPGAAAPTSPPTIVNGVVVLGQFVADWLSSDAPSGVVRGYDAITGELRWAWDAARPDRTGLPPDGEAYTPNTPNAWTVFSGDEALGLVFVPTGNALPDNYGAARSKVAEEFSSSIVAIDVATGRVRWSFRTVNHDVWDYDVPSQPVLADLPDEQGMLVPALIAPTKRGQLFVLDRRDGTPVDAVEQRPVPQGGDAGDWTAKTQPYTTGFPSVAGEPLSEAAMWGVTPLDQLWCRIRFKQARYEGEFTPPALRESIAYPGAAGGSNWGSVAVDTDRGLMVVSTLHVADLAQLAPRSQFERLSVSHYERTMLFPQTGFPYGFRRSAFMSPLLVPCQQPPYGRLSVFDTKTRQLLWSRSLGTALHSGPLGIESHLPIRIGVPNVGGAIATAGGLVFIGATQDRFLRAYDIGNGRELWRAPLPAVGAATPMTYRSKRTGRQYVFIAAGGHPGIPGPVARKFVAYALPPS